MMKISMETVVDGLIQALSYELPDAGELADRCFEQITRALRNDLRFCHLTPLELDLLLGDARRDFEHELHTIVNKIECRLLGDFKREIGIGGNDDE
jgi:hypothetical protein